ncbi:MAG TPA: FUSC family protein [Paraburkholderia sp.]|nr:FUSC family protein [Paraburkholderia sp.]
MKAFTDLRSRMNDEIKGPAVLKEALVLLPFLALTLTTGNTVWLKASLVAVAIMIADEHLDLTPIGVLLHGAAIICGIYLLFFTQVTPILFVLACMLLAAAVIRLAAEGSKLRAPGNWIFLPSIILAYELDAHDSPAVLFQQAPKFLPYLLVAVVPVLLFSIWKWAKRGAPVATEGSRFLSRLTRTTDLGPKTPYGETMAAMVTGVAAAALLVELFHMDHGQWVIWGVASVVTGTVDTARAKMRDRAIGVVVGVPAGIFLGRFVIPHSELAVILATLAIFMTLAAFRRYVVAYILRCTFVALAIILANESASVALERITHVLLGGLIGISCVLVCDFLVRKRKQPVERQG